MTTKMQQRRGTAAQWTSANTVLAAGELGVETDTHRVKCGDGSTAWNSLSYLTLADSEVTSAKIADGTIVNADINASAAIARSKISGLPTSSTDNTLPRFDSTGGALQTSGVVVDDSNNISGFGTLIPTTMVTATLGSELGNGVSLTQALTGLTVGQTYQVGPVSGTLTGATLDAVALTCTNNASSFVATATSHTVVGTDGTCTAISVKLVTARSATVAASVAGARLSQGQTNNTFGGVLPAKLTTGTFDTAFGYQAMLAVTTGSYNTAVGVNSQYPLTTGSYNTALGASVQSSLTSGADNTAVGYAAQLGLTTATQCTALGSRALQLQTAGGDATAVGCRALANASTGTGNTAVGSFAGRAFTTGSYNLALGSNAGNSGTTATVSGSVCIGTNSSGTGAQATDDNQIVLGVAAHATLIAGSLEMTGNGTGIIVRSPDGTRYRLGVANGGTVTAAAV